MPLFLRKSCRTLFLFALTILVGICALSCDYEAPKGTSNEQQAEPVSVYVWTTQPLLDPFIALVQEAVVQHNLRNSIQKVTLRSDARVLLPAKEETVQPEMILAESRELRKLSEEGRLLPLEKHISEAGLIPEEIHPWAWDAVKTDSTIFALPVAVSFDLLFVNLDLLQSQGLNLDRLPEGMKVSDDFAEFQQGKAILFQGDIAFLKKMQEKDSVGFAWKTLTKSSQGFASTDHLKVYALAWNRGSGSDPKDAYAFFRAIQSPGMSSIAWPKGSVAPLTRIGPDLRDALPANGVQGPWLDRFEYRQ
ncbi:MAG: hypothetical protein ACLFUS_07785 [Candidatus Sumerlaeia bacterium]